MQPAHDDPTGIAQQAVDQLNSCVVAALASDLDPAQAQAVSILTASGTPRAVATAAASAKTGLLDVPASSNGSQQLGSAVIVAASPEQEAGQGQQPDQARFGTAAGPAAVAAVSHQALPISHGNAPLQEAEQQRSGLTKGATNVEDTQAADQLPLSYPATLVATMPCTMPAWLGHSQRTAASTFIPTQIVTSQAPQSELGAAARAAIGNLSIQSPAADATLATGMALVPANISQVPATVPAAVSAPGDKPKCRLVTRLRQPGLTVQQGCIGSSQTAGGLRAAPGADLGAHQGPAGLPDEATEAAAVEQRLHPRVPESSKEARAAATAAERGKRPADGSPAVSGADKAAHKRARSNSPIAVKLKEQGLSLEKAGGGRMGPSDADVQVSPPFASRCYTLMCLQLKTSQGYGEAPKQKPVNVHRSELRTPHCILCSTCLGHRNLTGMDYEVAKICKAMHLQEMANCA